MQVLLGVAIGLVLTFAVMSVVVSSVMELISGVTRMRAHSLEQGIARMLDDQPKGGQSPYTQAVLQHPLISALSSARASKYPPSYIDAVTFSTAFLGTALPTTPLLTKFTEDRERLEERINALAAGEPGDTVKAAWSTSGQDPTKLIETLLAAPDQGAAAIAALLGTSVEPRIDELKRRRDPAAAFLALAWDRAEHDVESFVRQLAQPPSLVARAIAGTEGVESVLSEITHVNAHLGKSLNDLWQLAGADFTAFRNEIEDWFDREMARVSGWYSRWSQWIMVVVALVLAVALNISAVTVGRALWLDPTVRDKAVAVAQQSTTSTTTTTVVGQSTAPATTVPATAAPEPQTPTSTCSSSDATSTSSSVGVDTLCEIGLPIGWSASAWPGWDWYLALHLLGILGLAIAASFGAPFWFDLLNQLVNLRITGRPPTPAAQQRTDSN